MITQYHHEVTVSKNYNHHGDTVFLCMYVTKLMVAEETMESMGRHLSYMQYACIKGHVVARLAIAKIWCLLFCHRKTYVSGQDYIIGDRNKVIVRMWPL